MMYRPPLVSLAAAHYAIHQIGSDRGLIHACAKFEELATGYKPAIKINRVIHHLTMIYKFKLCD